MERHAAYAEYAAAELVVPRLFSSRRYKFPLITPNGRLEKRAVF